VIFITSAGRRAPLAPNCNFKVKSAAIAQQFDQGPDRPPVGAGEDQHNQSCLLSIAI
jgi:hypothetical protein